MIDILGTLQQVNIFGLGHEPLIILFALIIALAVEQKDLREYGNFSGFAIIFMTVYSLAFVAGLATNQTLLFILGLLMLFPIISHSPNFKFGQ